MYKLGTTEPKVRAVATMNVALSKHISVGERHGRESERDRDAQLGKVFE